VNQLRSSAEMPDLTICVHCECNEIHIMTNKILLSNNRYLTINLPMIPALSFISTRLDFNHGFR